MNVSSIVSSLVTPAAPGTSGPQNLAPRGAGKSPEAERKQVAAQFEAILVRQLLGQSLGSMMGGASGPGGNIYGYMLTDVLAQKLTAGQGLGLGRLIEKQLTPRGTFAPPADTPAAAAASKPTRVRP